MALSSTSTIAEVKAAYIDSADYAEARDLGKARTFIQACRILLLKFPRGESHGPSHTEFNPDAMQKQLDYAQQWLQANDSTYSNATRVSFEYSR